MDVLLSLNSSLITINSKTFQYHNYIISLSNNQQMKQPRMKCSVSCKATKNVPLLNHEEIDDENNLYKLLCLSPKSATIEDIKRAYRRMALRYHPDLCQDCLKIEESTRMFVEVNRAYKTLSNPELKEEYDSELGLGLRRRKSRWMEQVIELNRRSHTCKGGDSWGSRMRAKNNIKNGFHD